jgi:hypothetical protein
MLTQTPALRGRRLWEHDVTKGRREWIVGRAAMASALALIVASCDSSHLADFAPKAPRFMDLSPLPTNPTRPAHVLAPARLVGPDGSCPAATTESGFVGSGIALEMSECEVIERAGPPANMDIGANRRGERTAVMTYLQGERAGVYRFVSGRLTSIERVAQPDAPARPAKKPRAGS